MGLTIPMCWKHSRIAAEDFIRAAELNAAAVEKVETGARERMQDRAGDVYYLRVDGLIKIGHSKNVWTRMRSYPPTSELLAVEVGTRAIERQRHEKFRADLAHGREWFRESEELAAWIASVREAHGDPGGRAYRFTTPDDRKEVMRLRHWRG